jgi:hypothetical protein
MRFALLFLAACTGGGGTLVDDSSPREVPPGSSESGENTVEGAPRSNEAASVSNENGSFSCSGTYACVQEGKTKSNKVSLVMANGTCSVPGDDDDRVELRSDGSIVVNGEVFGSWDATDSGFSYTSSGVTVNCTLQ